LCKAVSVIEVRKKHTSWTGNDRCVFQRVSDLFRGKPVQRRVNREVFDDLEKKHARSRRRRDKMSRGATFVWRAADHRLPVTLI